MRYAPSATETIIRMRFSMSGLLEFIATDGIERKGGEKQHGDADIHQVEHGIGG
jgi:hypothetical protein